MLKGQANRIQNFYPDDSKIVDVPVSQFSFWFTNFIILFTQTPYIEPLMNYLALFLKVCYHCKRGVSKTVSDKLSLANKSYVGLVPSLLSCKFAKKYYC